MTLAIDLKAKGLYTDPNPLGTPQGALIQADNVVIDSDDIIEQRRGFAKYGSAITDVKKFFSYKGSIIVHNGTKMSYDSDGLGTWADYSGTYSPPSGVSRILSEEANRNFYFLTSLGVKKLDEVTGSVVSAGMPKALDGTAALTGASGWFATDGQVAYRVVWGKTDANSNKIIGSPSQRILVANSSGGDRNVNVTISIPSGITTSHFYQIYRSAASSGATAEPNDELQLIVEKNPTSGEITAGSITYTDMTPESLRGATLYASPSQQGILQANEPPPLAKDIANYKQMMLYANTISKHRLNITMISVGGSAGVQVADTIEIDGVTYTGAAAEDATAGEFEIITSGTPAENIDLTARSLVRVINRYSLNTTVYAFYMTGYDDLPGQILIEERGIGGTEFSAVSSRGGAFSPELPSSGTTYASANDTALNRVFISKLSQPEAVPLLQYLDCGSANKSIKRIIALRDSVFVLKEDGIFRIVGEDPTTLRQALFDNTSILINAESAVSFNNQIYCLTSQGVAAISDSGVAIMSRPIEDVLVELSASQYTNLDSVSFGLSYESDRKFILFTVSETTDTYSNQQYVYNYVTNSWTRWTLKASHAFVHDSDSRIYYFDPLLGYIMQERKSFTNMDYADDDVLLQITGQSGLTVEVVSSSGVVVGYTLSDGVRSSIITAIPDTTHITVTDLFTWPFGAARAYKPISCVVQWAPIHGGNPAIIKHFTDILMKFREATFDSLTLTYNSDLSGYDESNSIVPSFAGLWGYFPWGYPSWGGRDVFLQTIRTWAPLNKARARWLNFQIEHEQALANFALAGISINYRAMSLRSR